MAYILSSQDVRITQQSASIAARLGAFVIDGLIILAMYLVIASSNIFILFESASMEYTVPFFLFAPLLYPVICETTMSGQTVGKKVFHTRVVTLEGGGPKMTSFIMRWLMLPFDIIGAMGVGELCIFFTKRQQRLGDLVAGTWVVRTETYNTEHIDLSDYEVPNGFIPFFPRAKNLTPAQAALLEEVVSNYFSDEMIAAAEDLKKEVEAIVGPDTSNNTYSYFKTVLDNYRFEVAG